MQIDIGHLRALTLWFITPKRTEFCYVLFFLIPESYPSHPNPAINIFEGCQTSLLQVQMLAD